MPVLGQVIFPTPRIRRFERAALRMERVTVSTILAHFFLSHVVIPRLCFMWAIRGPNGTSGGTMYGGKETAPAPVSRSIYIKMPNFLYSSL